MFRVPLSIAIILLIAFGGATASAIYALRATVGFGSIDIGAWKAWPKAQTGSADPYAKAHRARSGRLLLGEAEGLAFVAVTDDDGGQLSTDCTYSIKGLTPLARMWTLHLADGNDQLLTVDRRFPSALHSQNVLKDDTGAFEIEIGTAARSGNWIATGDAKQPFRLVLTLFDTPTASSSRLIDLQMPNIVKLGCADG